MIYKPLTIIRLTLKYTLVLPITLLVMVPFVLFAGVIAVLGWIIDGDTCYLSAVRELVLDLMRMVTR